jgi:hypothetical protein
MTDKVARVTLPREVAEAIELAKKSKYSDDEILIRAAAHGFVTPELMPLESVDIMTLAKALINGYEIEKSPEDKVREYYEGLIETKTDPLNDPYTRELAAYEASGVVKTLNLLDIKVPGVNEPVPGVNADA